MKYLLLLIVALSITFIFAPNKASAATINVSPGCTLDNAILSMNSASNQGGCTASGTYGSNDTISLSAGTFNYANTNVITVPLTVQGAGMGQTIIDAQGNNGGLSFNNPNITPQQATVQDVTIKNPNSILINDYGAINTFNYSMTIRRVEVYADVAQSVDSSMIEVSAWMNGISSTIEDIYIHDIIFENSAIFITSNGATTSGNIVRRTTITNVEGTKNDSVLLVCFYSRAGGHTSGLAENITITDVTATNGYSISYISAIADSLSGGDGEVNVTARNITIIGNPQVGVTGSGILSASLATPGASAASSIDFQNILGVNLDVFNAEFEPNAGGTESATSASLGGNITDATATSELNHPTDQAEIVGLSSSLGPLQDNGGTIQTIALLENSAAIDAGVTNSLTTDQRGIARPQGSGYDSGAYEYIPPIPDPIDPPVSNTTHGQLADTGDNIKLYLSLTYVLFLLGLVGIGLKIWLCHIKPNNNGF